MKQNGSSSKKNHNFLKNHLVVYSRISLRHSKKSKKKQKKVLEESLRGLLGNSTARSTEQLGLPMKNWGCKTPRTVSSFLLSKSPLIPTGLFGDSSVSAYWPLLLAQVPVGHPNPERSPAASGERTCWLSPAWR